jgi:hypothetical protein
MERKMERKMEIPDRGPEEVDCGPEEVNQEPGQFPVVQASGFRRVQFHDIGEVMDCVFCISGDFPGRHGGSFWPSGRLSGHPGRANRVPGKLADCSAKANGAPDKLAAMSATHNGASGRVADSSARASGVPGKVAVADGRANRKRERYGSGGVSRPGVRHSCAAFVAFGNVDALGKRQKTAALQGGRDARARRSLYNTAISL